MDAELLQRPQEMGPMLITRQILRRSFLKTLALGGAGIGGISLAGRVVAPITISDAAGVDIKNDILPVYNIRSPAFRGVVDGVTDDSAAWQAAANAVRNSGRGGGAIYTPPGTSLVQNPSTVYGPVVVMGAGPLGSGSIIKAGANFPTNRGMFEIAPGTAVPPPSDENDGITFWNIEGNGNRDNIRAGVGSGNTVDFVRVNQQMNSQMDRFMILSSWIHDFTGRALNFDQTAFGTQRKIRDMIIMGSWFHGNTNPNAIANNSGASEQEGFVFTGTDTPHIIGDYFEKWGRANIHMIADNVDRLTGGMIADCNFRAAGAQNFDGSGGTTEGYNLWLEAQAGNGMKDLVVMNNKFVVARREGLSFNAVGTGKLWKMSFLANVYRNNNNDVGFNGTDADGAGIRFRGGGVFSDITLQSGFLDTDGINNQKYGVTLDAGTYTKVQFLGVDFAASAIAAILDNAGAAQDVAFYNCPGLNPQGMVPSFNAGASPYTYTNQDHVPEEVYVLLGSGGTISQISKNGINTNFVPTTTLPVKFTLQPQESIIITWATTAPVLFKDRK